MIPAYQVSAELTLEVCFAIAELDSNPSREDITEFTGKDGRRIREAIKISREFGILRHSEGEITLKTDYARDLQMFNPNERYLILYDALLHHQPFMQFLSYLKKDYSAHQAAQRINAVYDISSDSEHIQDYFLRYGEYAGILRQDTNPEVDIETELIPNTGGNGTAEQLLDSLESEAEIRLYLETTLGEETIQSIDPDVVDQLTEAFKIFVQDPRKSIEESGRAIEDYLRELGVELGSDDRDYQGASGIVPLTNHLKGDDLIEKTHQKFIFDLAERRNRAAHGKDTESMQRWRITPEAGLSTAMDAVIVIRSIHIEINDSGGVL